MSTQANKAIFRRIYEEFLSQGKSEVAAELFDANHVNHLIPPGAPQGLEGEKQFIASFRTAFPDVQFSIEDMIAEGDKVVGRVTWRGTHRGEFMGVRPTGRRVAVEGIDIICFANGKAVENWFSGDTLGMMQQLGAIPTPGEGKA
jgi:predicted ester cyclase